MNGSINSSAPVTNKKVASEASIYLMLIDEWGFSATIGVSRWKGETFTLGQIVYVKSDPEQKPNQIVSIALDVSGGIAISISRDGSTLLVYPAELTSEKNLNY